MKKELVVLIIASEFILFASGLFGPIYAIFVQDIGGDLVAAGEAYAAFAIASGIVIILLSRWEDKVKHQEKLVTLGFVLNGVGFICYTLVRNPFELILVQVLVGFADALWIPPFFGQYTRLLDKGKYDFEWGFGTAMDKIVLGVAAFFGGYAAELYGFTALFYFMAGICFVGARGY